VNNSLIGAVVHVGEEWKPVFWHVFAGNGKAMILSCHEAAASATVQTRLVVSTVTIPRIQSWM
jgi:hypothetical protein